MTSRSILPTLPFLFDTSSPYHQPLIHGVASINYRLSPHPNHETQPSQPGDPSRSSKWPDYIEDVKAGVQWVLENGDDEQTTVMRKGVKRPYILAGHSVGGTMSAMIAQSSDLDIPLPLAVIPLCGIYNFTTLRDSHLEHRALYDAFTTAAFGPEADGGWEFGNCTQKQIRSEVKAVVTGHGKEDKLVDWGQLEEMRGVLDEVNADEGRNAVVIEVQGDHNDVWKKGKEVAMCVGKAVELLRGVGRM